jgi:DNA-binding MarR family transcriptional regulator
MMDEAPAPAIGFLLQRAHNALRSRLVAQLEGTDLHLGHVAILGTTFASPGLSQRDLSRVTGIEKSSIVIFVDHLERTGWLRRAPHPGDRRAHALYITSEGATRLADIGPKLAEAEARFLSPLSEDERGALLVGLTKLTDAGSG